jgi:hypothetical protein
LFYSLAFLYTSDSQKYIQKLKNPQQIKRLYMAIIAVKMAIKTVFFCLQMATKPVLLG